MKSVHQRPESTAKEAKISKVERNYSADDVSIPVSVVRLEGAATREMKIEDRRSIFQLQQPCQTSSPTAPFTA